MYDDNEFRRYLTELYREDDRLRAEREHEERLARQKAQASPLVRQTEPVATSPYGDGDVLYAAPAPEPEAFDEERSSYFTEAQDDVLVHVIAELRREFGEAIERTEQRLLDMMVRMAMPGERAEETAYALKDRVARMEGRIERQTSDLVDRRIAELQGENTEIRGMLGRALALFKQKTESRKR